MNPKRFCCLLSHLRNFSTTQLLYTSW